MRMNTSTTKQSRRNSIVIDGISESPDESWSESEKKLRGILTGKMKIDQRHIEIEQGSCWPVMMGKRPRPMVVKLLRHKDKLTPSCFELC